MKLLSNENVRNLIGEKREDSDERLIGFGQA